MVTDVTFRIGGQAGQGLQIISSTLGRTLARGGYHVFTSQDVMSRVRGGHNFTDVRVADHPVSCHHDLYDVLIALDARSVQEDQGQLRPGGVLVYDQQTTAPTPGKWSLLAAPLEELASRVGKDKRMANSVALGAALSITGYPLEPLLDVLRQHFAYKGDNVVRLNVECARAGSDFAQKAFNRTCPCQLPAQAEPVSRLFTSGAEAVGLSAVLSGLQLYTGYPMSPSTPIMEYLAARAREHGMIVLQAEDEISAINLALGASWAGARAMTGSAGGGFSLMVESLSLAGMTETPIVIALCSRPGPATGLATRQAQADLLFAVHAAHGEFDRIVFAPGSAEQAFYETNLALDLAEKYQVPAILLLDQHLNDSYWSVDSMDESRLLRRRYLTDGADLPPYAYLRYAAGSDARLSHVSPMLRPGSKNQVRYDDSDEHTEEGHIAEAADIRRAMVTKRLGKARDIGIELGQPECYPAEQTSTVVLNFGSTLGVVREAVDLLRARGAPISMMHFSRLCPFPHEAVMTRLAKVHRVVTVENNATAQLARLVTMRTGLPIADSVLRYDGRPFTLEPLTRELDKQV